MTIRTDSAALWDIGEDDYGDPMIFHRHTAGPVPAYVISRWEGGTVAQCSGCMAFLQLEDAERPSAASTPDE